MESSRCPRMFYWGLDDDLAAVSVLLSALSVYVSYDITRISKGAPRGWYLIIGAFLVFLVFRIAQLYFDSQSASDLIDDWEASLAVLTGIMLLAGLVMLDRSFKTHQKALQGSE
jgi:hypothetical protein